MDSESKLRFVQEVLDVDHIFGLGGKHFHRKKHVFRFLIKNGWELFGHFLQKLVNFEFSFYNNPISGKVWWAFQIFDKFFVLTTICPLKMGLNIPKIPNFTIYTGKRSCSFFLFNCIKSVWLYNMWKFQDVCWRKYLSFSGIEESEFACIFY